MACLWELSQVHGCRAGTAIAESNACPELLPFGRGVHAPGGGSADLASLWAPQGMP